MKRSKLIAGIGASIALGLAAATVHAHQGMGGMGHGMHAMQGGNKAGMGCAGEGMERQGGMRPHGGMGERGAAAQLFTPEERTAFREKMRSAATPEERQKLRDEQRAEAEKRAKDKGIALGEPRGPRGQGEGRHRH